MGACKPHNDPTTCTGYVDEASGTVVVDSSGNGNDGTFVGDPARLPGKIGGALDFDGIDDHVEVPESAELELPGDFISGNRTGTVGVRFGVVPPASKAELDAWLNRQIQQTTPGLNSGRTR